MQECSLISLCGETTVNIHCPNSQAKVGVIWGKVGDLQLAQSTQLGLGIDQAEGCQGYFQSRNSTLGILCTLLVWQEDIPLL